MAGEDKLKGGVDSKGPLIINRVLISLSIS